jgi:hypothetical protein
MRHAIILIGAALLLASCDSSTTANGPNAGGDDFPNSVTALGRELALGMDSSQSWNGLDSATTGVGTGNALSDTANAGSARRLAAACVDTSYLTLAGSEATWTSNACLGASGFVRDSSVIAYFTGADSANLDTVYWSSVDTSLLGYESYTTLQDASGRGYFLIKSADTGKVQYTVKRTAGGWTDLQNVLASGGADGILGTGGDNAFWLATRVLLRPAGDTATWVSLSPYNPSAGIPVYGGPGDSGVTWAQKLVRDATWRHTERGLLVDFRDSTLNYPRFWQATTVWNVTGWNRWQAAFNPKSVDSTFKARDTVTLLDRFHSGLTADSTHIEAHALLGPDLRKPVTDSLLSVSLERLRVLQNDRHTIWQFTSDTPVASGAQPTSGTLFARVDFADKTYVQFHGHLSQGIFSGTYSNGTDSATVVVARNGTVQSSTKL